MKRNQKIAVLAPDPSRKKRAEQFTAKLKEFENQNKWGHLGAMFVEMEDERLYEEVGCESWNEWVDRFAPQSYGLCYMIKSRFKALIPYFTVEQLNQMPPQTADWASKAKNISPEALRQPNVKEALRLPKQKAVKLLREALPLEHIEDVQKITFKFEQSQHDQIVDAYEAFKRLKDEKASFEDFVEFAVSEWMESVYQIRDQKSVSVRQCWEAMKGSNEKQN